jgi:hypothetical protein
MKISLQRFFAVAGLTAALGTASQAGILETNPSDSIVTKKVSNNQIIAPTATSQLSGQSCSSISCCDTGSSCCDSGCGRKPWILSSLFGSKCDDGCCDDLGCGLSGCDSGCDACGCKSGLLGYGIVKPSEQCFSDFISPVSNPVFFEDPRTLTEVRFLFLHHNLPNALTGNSVQAYAAQIRLALSERLSFIATKDGFVYTQSPLLDSGFLDVAAGFKYNLYRDPNAGRILSVGTTFEIPMGSQKSLQGNGSGEFNFFATGGTRLFGSNRAHWLSAGGLRQPTNENAENRVAYWSNHFDYRLGTSLPIYAFTEFNWWNYLSDGTAFPGGPEGGDIFNLGSSGITGNDLVTQAVGARIKPRRNIEMGSAYEFPLTARQGLMKDRITMDLIVRY